MIAAADFVRQASVHGYGLYTGVPCSYLTPFINYTISDSSLVYIPAANEGDAVALAAGAWLAGMNGVVMMQNSGLGNAVSPLTSLNAIFRIPLLLVVTMRGEPGGAPDEPQHALMGQITSSMLDLMQIRRWSFPREPQLVPQTLREAHGHAQHTRLPVALLMSKGTVEAFSLAAPQVHTSVRGGRVTGEHASTRPTRRQALEAVLGAIGPNDVIVATTGYTGRVLYDLQDRAGNFYMVGSMGCASSLALGIAIARPHARVVVVDGDGAALMRMGALAAIGVQQPPNLLHIVLDNEVHDSTGGQTTTGGSTDFAAVAAACGYPESVRVATLHELAGAVQIAGRGLSLLHLKTSPGEAKEPPRPTISPAEVAERLREHLSNL